MLTINRNIDEPPIMNFIVDLFAILKKAEINIPIPNPEPQRATTFSEAGLVFLTLKLLSFL